MIAKGNLHGEGTKLAAYMTTGKDGERAELVELRGFASDDIRTAFLDVEIQAYGTRSTKPFFHAYTRLPEGEDLTREQWMLVADREEKRLGFDGQPRAISFHHQLDGSKHMHIAWSRIDSEAGRAIDPGLFKNKLKELCRTLESELQLTPVRNERAPDDRTRSAGRNEFEQARRLDTDLKEIRTTIRDCWERSDNGKSFAAVLDAEGLILARGDRRDFVVIDHAGGEHALSKRITGATAAQTRTRLSDIDRAQLPSVDAAKAQQVELQSVRDERAQEQAIAQAMQEAREAAKGRVDDTRADFGVAAARLSEPHAPNFDRDSGEAAWLDELAAAAIAKDQAARTAQDRKPEPQAASKEMPAAEPQQAFEPERSEPAAADRPAEEPAQDAIEAAATTVERGLRAAGAFFGSMARAVENTLGGLFNFFAGSEPKLSHDQADRAARAADERPAERAEAAAEQERTAVREQQPFEENRNQQQTDRTLSERFGKAPPRETNSGRECVFR